MRKMQIGSRCLWHETDMPTALRDVRSQGQSGKHLLALSFSGFDPTRTLGLPAFQPNWAVCCSPLRRKVLESSVCWGIAMLSADRCGLIREDHHGECHRHYKGLIHPIQGQQLEQGEGHVAYPRPASPQSIPHATPTSGTT